MAKKEMPQYDTLALLVLLERLRRMPGRAATKKMHERMRAVMGGR